MVRKLRHFDGPIKTSPNRNNIATTIYMLNRLECKTYDLHSINSKNISLAFGKRYTF